MTTAILLGPLLVALVVGAIWWSPWFWLGVLAIFLLGLWAAWVIHRQVPAASWIELPDELVIRTGVMFRTLVAIPYGRLQYVDVQSGPLMRANGIASVQIHTASPHSGGTIPGLPLALAEDLRARLAQRGEAQRAGL